MLSLWRSEKILNSLTDLFCYGFKGTGEIDDSRHMRLSTFKAHGDGRNLIPHRSGGTAVITSRGYHITSGWQFASFLTYLLIYSYLNFCEITIG